MSLNVSSIGISDGVDEFVVYAQVDPPSILSDATASQSYSLDGVAIGDSVQVVAPYDAQQVIMTAAPSGEGTIDLNFHNVNAATVDLAAAEFKFLITRA